MDLPWIFPVAKRSSVLSEVSGELRPPWDFFLYLRVILQIRFILGGFRRAWFAVVAARFFRSFLINHKGRMAPFAP